MQELPEDLLITDKILYLTGLDGESQAPLMEKLAKVAQELYGKKWFYALIPFGSRTKGLSQKDSDIDILIIVSDTRTLGVSHIVQEKLSKKDIKAGKVYIMKKERYIECLTSKEGTEIECNAVAGVILGPSKMKGVRKQIKKQTPEMKRSVADKILFQIHVASVFRKRVNSIWSAEHEFKEPAESRIGDNEKRKAYIKNRRRLWEKRIRHLLDYKGEL